MEWLYLSIAGLAEVALVYCLNRSEGFKNKGWSLLVLASSGCSIFLLSKGMEYTEAGTAYSIWVAAGSIGSIMLGYFIFDEKVTWKEIFFLFLIIVSVIGLKLSV